MRATVTYVDPTDGSEQIKLGRHEFQFGGQGDGYCYGHQSFDCLDKLTAKQREAISAAVFEVDPDTLVGDD